MIYIYRWVKLKNVLVYYVILCTHNSGQWMQTNFLWSMGKEFLPSHTHTYVSRKTLRYSNGTIHIIPGKKQCSQQRWSLGNRYCWKNLQNKQLKIHQRRVSTILTTNWRHISLFRPYYEQWFVQSNASAQMIMHETFTQVCHKKLYTMSLNAYCSVYLCAWVDLSKIIALLYVFK